MADEWVFESPPLTGTNLYAVAAEYDTTNGRETANIWDVAGQAFEAAGATKDDYDVALTEVGSTGRFKASLPAGFTATSYVLRVYRRAGGSPAWTDLLVGGPALYGLAHLATESADAVAGSVENVLEPYFNSLDSAVDATATSAELTAATSGLATAAALATVGGNVTTILGQTGTTGVAVSSSAVAAILAGILAGTVDGKTISVILARLNAMARGKIVANEALTEFQFMAEDNTTPLFTLTIGALTRTSA